MGLLVKLGLRRPMQWERPTLLDWILESPLQAIVFHLYLLVLWLRGNPVKPPRNRPPIKIVCLSDTHDSIVQDVPDGDLLVHCGDTTNDGTVASIQKQVDWLVSLPHQHKVLVCGNHDSWFDIRSRMDADTLGHKAVDTKTLHYLEHKSITLNFKGGRRLNIYGAPDIPKCGGPEHAFQYIPSTENPWAGTIPLDTEILITHTPPKHHLDLSLGCPNLLREIWEKKPKVHIFGHVHWGRGVQPIFWDECQKSYEKVMSRPKRGLILDMIPHKGWLDAWKVFYYGFVSVLWHWFMLGGVANGSVMINAAMQHGTSGKLTKKPPITIEI
ncbi:Metallo-dependent phosphatase [Annulohypoxylon truncatum]|uniref:Metallo-dependent phosphatase n=1 Tax=Annulohypoxylon truncatum TaxID=327061 RepID=UPI002008480D|nr:Metallo-dependent phosphatase [Annulohypoxylon truncatum]KAI1207952.1 Metallo-dependent phosphatase [Annulohypoxylon truncatum]